MLHFLLTFAGLALLFILPVWAYTAAWWFDLDGGVKSRRLRLWRAATWLPWSIWRALVGGREP